MGSKTGKSHHRLCPEGARHIEKKEIRALNQWRKWRILPNNCCLSLYISQAGPKWNGGIITFSFHIDWLMQTIWVLKASLQLFPSDYSYIRFPLFINLSFKQKELLPRMRTYTWIGTYTLVLFTVNKCYFDLKKTRENVQTDDN